MILYFLLTLCTLSVILGIALVNARRFPRLHSRAAPCPEDSPTISILIPARNEAATIAATVTSLLLQEYDNITELFVLDDGSTDGTADVARQAGLGDARLRVIEGEPLPVGWVGKNWACHQLAQYARSDLLLFTDADVQWEPAAVVAVVNAQRDLNADLLTVWPTQKTVTFTERLVVPLMAFSILGYLPLSLAHHRDFFQAAAANGQCLAFRRHAYAASGGHAAVADSIVEDVTFARNVKRAGLRLRMADGNRLIRCRMYQGWPQVRDGYAKNILAGHGDSPSFLLLSTVFHLALFVLPWIWLLWGSVVEASRGWPWLPLSLVALGISVRGVTAYATHQRLRDALLMPISVLLMTRIAAQALWWRFRYGGPRWKDRTILHVNDVRQEAEKEMGVDHGRGVDHHA